MPKKSWNKFVGTCQSAITFTAKVSAGLPKQLQFDKNGKKLPTPYGLFVEWAEASLTGDWSSTSIRGGGFAVSVELQTDAQIVMTTFGTIGAFQKTTVSNRTIQVNYKDSDYAGLAKKLGYQL
ncbi:hypothetical protein [Vogesella sp. LIG4]|uniref:hypothetical protein n=1 Tax=Vogesella sp. LIG4 TaxID=1192162 RepID=UPI0012FD9F7D|nr:hypothetical protein [Vogesella sp. LIG4]